MTSPGETLIQSVTNPEVLTQDTDIKQGTVGRLGHLAARLALSLSIAASGGVSLAAASEVAGPQQAAAAVDIGGYPDAGLADCSQQFGTYSWCRDENNDGGFDPGEQNSPRGYDYRNCTDWVAWRTSQLGVGSVPAGLGNASKWDDNALKTWGQDGTPEPGDIAQSETTSPFGHVGVVEKVGRNADGVITSIEVSEYNQAGHGEYDINVYTPDNNGVFWRNAAKTKKWDKFLDLNGAGKGINGETLAAGDAAAIHDLDDLVIYRPVDGTGYWYAMSSDDDEPTPIWGAPHGGWSQDVPVVGDFNGDEVDDFGIYRPVNGTGYWYVKSGGDGQPIPEVWGVAHGGWPQDKPVSGDFDGDGRDDLGIYRLEADSTGRWYVKSSKAGNPPTPIWGAAHGSPGDLPVVGDFNGDQVDDFGVYRMDPTTSTGLWYVKSGGNGSPTPIWGSAHGSPGDVPVVGKLDGDDVDDFGVYRVIDGTGHWYFKSGGNGQPIPETWDEVHGGWPQDKPLVGNFD